MRRSVVAVGAMLEPRLAVREAAAMVTARLEAAIGLVKLVAQGLAQRIALVGARHGDGGDAFARLDFDQTHWRPPVLLAPDASSRPYSPHQETPMQTRNPFIYDLTKMSNCAMGAW